MFEHTRVPQIKEVLNPFYKINIEKEVQHHLPIISRVNYKYSHLFLNFFPGGSFTVVLALSKV